MGTPNQIRNKVAEAAVTKYRILKHGAADDQVLHADGVSAKLAGISTEIDTDINDRCDVIKGGIAEVEYGGTVARGDDLTSDGTGRAIAAAPAVGVNNNIIGQSEVSGVVGDIGSVNISISVKQGA